MIIKVWSPEHLINHARSVVGTLTSLGHDATLIDTVIAEDDNLYLIYCPQVCPTFPKNYIVYHTEHAERFLVGFKNRQIFENAMMIWAHTPETIQYLKIAYPHLNCELVPPGLIDYPIEYFDRVYDVTFYGNMNEKRWHTISMLRLYGIKVNLICPPNSEFGIPLLNKLQQSKIVLNLHYDTTAPLELFRIHEGLSMGCHVISEKSSIDGFRVNYSNIVNFIDDPYKMILWINYLVKNDIKPGFSITELDNRSYIEEAMKKIVA